MSDYWSILGFEGLYLEDSWVLDITARPGVLEFVVDLVLRESHPRYERRRLASSTAIAEVSFDSKACRR